MSAGGWPPLESEQAYELYEIVKRLNLALNLIETEFNIISCHRASVERVFVVVVVGSDR